MIGEESADKAANTSLDLKQVIVQAGSVGGQNLSKDEFISLGESEVPKVAEKVNDREAADEEMKTENENNEDDKVRKVNNVKIKKMGQH